MSCPPTHTDTLPASGPQLHRLAILHIQIPFLHQVLPFPVLVSYTYRSKGLSPPLSYCPTHTAVLTALGQPPLFSHSTLIDRLPVSCLSPHLSYHPTHTAVLPTSDLSLPLPYYSTHTELPFCIRSASLSSHPTTIDRFPVSGLSLPLPSRTTHTHS